MRVCHVKRSQQPCFTTTQITTLLCSHTKNQSKISLFPRLFTALSRRRLVTLLLELINLLYFCQLLLTICKVYICNSLCVINYLMRVNQIHDPYRECKVDFRSLSSFGQTATIMFQKDRNLITLNQILSQSTLVTGRLVLSE